MPKTARIRDDCGQCLPGWRVVGAVTADGEESFPLFIQERSIRPGDICVIVGAARMQGQAHIRFARAYHETLSGESRFGYTDVREGSGH